MVPSIESCIPSEILMPKDRLHNLSHPDLEAKRSAFERFQSSCNEKFQAIQQVQQDSNRKKKNSKLDSSRDTTTITKPVPAYTSTYLAIAVMTKGVESTKKSSEFERIERIVMLERSPHGSAYFVESFDDRMHGTVLGGASTDLESFSKIFDHVPIHFVDTSMNYNDAPDKSICIRSANCNLKIMELSNRLR